MDKITNTSIALALQSKDEVRNLPSTFLAEDKKQIEAFLGNKVALQGNLSRATMIAEKMAYSVRLTGYKTDSINITEVAAIFSEILLEEYPNITFEELDIIFKQGALGNYGEFMGLSPKTFNGWVKEYMTSLERKASIKRYLDLKLQEMDKVWSEQDIKNVYEGAYASDKAKEIHEVKPTYQMYDYVVSIGLLSLSVEEKKQLAQEVKDNIYALAVNERDQNYKKLLFSYIEDKELFAQECKKEAYLRHLKKILEK